MENLHHLTIENKRKLTVTDAKEVMSFSDKEIKLGLKDGGVLSVLGENLKITCFDDKNGTFCAVGKIFSTRYKEKAQTFIKKVFS